MMGRNAQRSRLVTSFRSMASKKRRRVILLLLSSSVVVRASPTREARPFLVTTIVQRRPSHLFLTNLPAPSRSSFSVVIAEVCLHGLRRMKARQACVVSVRPHAQKLLVHEQIEH